MNSKFFIHDLTKDLTSIEQQQPPRSNQKCNYLSYQDDSLKQKNANHDNRMECLNNSHHSNMEHKDSNLNLKTGHKCLGKLDVNLIIDDSLQTSRKIGLVQGDSGSYGFFIWIPNQTNKDNPSMNDLPMEIEIIIPIDRKFNFDINTENDLCLLIKYGIRADDYDLPTLKTMENNTTELKDQILLEYDPLMNIKNDCHAKPTKPQRSKGTQRQERKENVYQFLLFYSEMTELFVSTLQHIVSISHRTFTEHIDFEWTKQYSLSTLCSLLPLSSSSSLDNQSTSDIHPSEHDHQQNFNKESLTFSMKNIEDKSLTALDCTNDNRNIDLLTISMVDGPPTAPSQHHHQQLSSNLNYDNRKSINDLQKVQEEQVLIDETHYSNITGDDVRVPDHGNSYLVPEALDHFSVDADCDSSLMFNDFNRELQIQIATEERKNEYVRYENYTLFIGTWNVNGQIMANREVFRTHFLAIDPVAPDFYAIGFQELDLSKEAFLFNDNKREDYWVQLCEQSLHPKKNYYLVKKIRLIGMMLVIFASKEFEQHIKNVAAETVGTGILGKMGNKGGVAIRFDLHDTSICFVNCHLAAHVEQFRRRNIDYKEIKSRLQFFQFKSTPKRIFDHEQIYWFGDLNYRITSLSTDLVKSLLDAKDYDSLLNYDQLRQQMLAKNCFEGFTEGSIRHIPSYKYNPGTNQWDSSEKQRPPAWCDRILWRGEHIKQVSYRSHPQLKDSDHKPVSALFDSQVSVVNYALKRKVYEDVMKKMDKLENELLPQVSIDTTEINFGTVSFRDNPTRSLNLTNIGQSRIKFRFINKLNDTKFCKPWIRVSSSNGTFGVKEQITINFDLNFDDPSIAYKFNYGIESFSDTLVLRLIGGKDIFITISGDFKPSCFGCSLQTLIQLEKPISLLTLEEFRQKFGEEVAQRKLNYEERLIEVPSPGEPQKNTLPIPKELFALIDHLIRHGFVNVNIFQSSGMENEFFIIRDALDSNSPSKINNISEHSIAEALLLFLETLPEPVIPYRFYNRIVRAKGNISECRQIYSEMPEIHRSVFQYLMMFLQEMCNCSGTDKLLTKLYIAKLFGPILIRQPSNPIGGSINHSNSDSYVSSTVLDSNILLMSALSNSKQNTALATSSSTSSLSNLTNMLGQMALTSAPSITSNYSSTNSSTCTDSLTSEQFFLNLFLNTTLW